MTYSSLGRHVADLWTANCSSVSSGERSSGAASILHSQIGDVGGVMVQPVYIAVLGSAALNGINSSYGDAPSFGRRGWAPLTWRPPSGSCQRVGGTSRRSV